MVRLGSLLLVWWLAPQQARCKPHPCSFLCLPACSLGLQGAIDQRMATNINSAAELAVLLTVRFGGCRPGSLLSRGCMCTMRILCCNTWLGWPALRTCLTHPPILRLLLQVQAGVILLSMLGVNVSALLLPAGIAVAVAAKDLSHNFLAGFFLMVVQPFRCDGVALL